MTACHPRGLIAIPARSRSDAPRLVPLSSRTTPLAFSRRAVLEAERIAVPGADARYIATMSPALCMFAALPSQSILPAVGAVTLIHLTRSRYLRARKIKLQT